MIKMKTLVFVGLTLMIAACSEKVGNTKQEVKHDSIVEMESLSSSEQFIAANEGLTTDGNESKDGFDGDPNISGSTENILPIMKSIADGDARKLASLCCYPISRRYPLHDIVNSSDMIQRFNQIFDKDFRKRMKSSTAADWSCGGWRGYAYGEDLLLWVYDSLTMIDYYSPQEEKLYKQLVTKEMKSLHKSLNGKGWFPYCCFKDKTDGSIIRVDIKAREETKEENFHIDKVALKYPQIHSFKLNGDEEFRMAIYPKKSNLADKPQLILSGYVEIGGSANFRDYYFKDNKGLVITYGDLSYEGDKMMMNIKNKKEETSHEIASCYWLDLIK